VKSRFNPQFCIITPTEYLHRYAIQSNTHLVLAHIVNTDHAYSEFYNKRAWIGDVVIMDNGAFELGESYAPDKLIDLGHKCGASVIVLPDYPAVHWCKTVDAAVEVLPKIKQAGFKTMFVPQSAVGDWCGFVSGYQWGASNPDIDSIGMSILALPNALPHIPASFARVVGTELLVQQQIFNFEKYHHYLGLNAGPALEIPSLIKIGALDSCDSSGPVWSAICGQMYTKSADSYLPTRKISKHVDFNYPWTHDKCVHNMIQHNINLTLELFKQ